ncbi:MAG: tetratricopeptide repeat protein, partial [Alphaproteobacteria bacterium]
AAGEPNSLSILITSVVLGALLITFISTARVWRRGHEVALAGFGDHLTPVGTRYTVREAPRAHAKAKAVAAAPAAIGSGKGEPAKAAAVKAASGKLEPALVPPTTEQLGKGIPKYGPRTDGKDPAPIATAALKDVAKGADAKPAGTEPKAEKKAAAEPAKGAFRAQKPAERGSLARAAREPRKTLPLRSSTFKAKGTSKAEAEAPAAKAEAVAKAEPAAEPKQPKTVRRQLFKRAGTTYPVAAQLQGAFGFREPRDRLFAGDYLKQTNEAFEAAHLKGKGPNFSNLRLSDNHRAERLFMMATRAAAEDPSTALAALWQAVEEDQADAVAWLRLAHCYLELGQTDRAERILAPLQSQAEKAGLPGVVAAAANSRGRIAAQKGNAEGARKLLSAAVSAAEGSDNPFLLGISAANLGVVEAAKGKAGEARKSLERAVKALDGCGERVAAARTRVALGAVLRGLGQAQEAERTWSEASDALHTAKLADEAKAVDRWLKGETPPAKITL